MDNRLAFAQFFVINTFSVKKNCGSTTGNFCIDVVLYSLQRASFSKPVILENLCGEKRNFRKVCLGGGGGGVMCIKAARNRSICGFLWDAIARSTVESITTKNI